MVNYILDFLSHGFILFIIWYVVVINGIHLLEMFAALFITPSYVSRMRNSDYRLIGASNNLIPVSLLVPAYNEELTVVDSIKSMLNLNYLNYEVVVINDGSSDNTLNAIINAFGLRKITYPIREQLAAKKIRGIYYNPDIPRLHLIDKENGGKYDALNTGINFSRYPYFVALDADSLLDADALLHIAMAFMQDKYTIAVGGIIRAANGCKIADGKILDTGLPRNGWALFQTMEYLRSFLVGRIVLNRINSMLVISGAFGAFQKSAVLSVGGYTAGALGGDMDLVIKLIRYMQSRKYKYTFSYLPNAVCWTQVPESFGALYRQRRRWQIGLMEVLGRYRKMFFKPGNKLIGMLALPYYFLLEIISPVIELFGFVLVPLAWKLNYISPDSLYLFCMAVFGFGIVTSIGSLAVEEFTNSGYIKMRELFKLSFLSIAENLFYRQLMVLVRFLGIFSYRQNKHIWGDIERYKFGGQE